MVRFLRRLAGVAGGDTAEVGPGAVHSAYSLDVDYPVEPKVRYGYGAPAHPGLSALFAQSAEVSSAALASFVPFFDRLADIDLLPSDTEPGWSNDALPGLDTAAIYCFLATRNPRLYLEIGSGNSTKVARRAIRDNTLRTRIVSVDPEPRAEVDAICDETVRSPLEDTPLDLFDRLQPGDVVFFDDSHRCFQNSDVTTCFLDVLPRIPPGVLVGIHDICLPFDYPASWLDRYYSEQYLLAAFLLGGHRGYDVVLPSFYCTVVEPCDDAMTPLWRRERVRDIHRHGSAFWMERVEARYRPSE